MKKGSVLLSLGPLLATSMFSKVSLAHCLRRSCHLFKSLPGFDFSIKALSCATGLGIVSLLLPAAGHCFVQADLNKLLTTNECTDCDLTETDLSGKSLTKANLDGANLSWANLTNTILRMADLEGADFSNANLTYTVFEAADLYRANFAGAILDGTIFDGAYLVEAVFSGEQIVADQDKEILKVGAVAEDSFGRKETQEIKPSGEGTRKESIAQIISGAPQPPKVDVALSPVVETIEPDQSFKALTLLPGGAVDPNKYIPDPSLNIAGFKPLPEDTNLPVDREKVLMPLSKDDLIDQVDESQMCVGCDFSGMDLADTKFKGIYLEGANFEGANLQGANLRSTNLKRANLRNANLKNADLREADLYKADLTRANLSGADLKGALVVGADLTGANLEDTVLSPVAP